MTERCRKARLGWIGHGKTQDKDEHWTWCHLGEVCRSDPTIKWERLEEKMKKKKKKKITYPGTKQQLARECHVWHELL